MYTHFFPSLSALSAPHDAMLTPWFVNRDFTSTQILDDFCDALEPSLQTQLTESGLFMGTSLYVFSFITWGYCKRLMRCTLVGGSWCILSARELWCL
jgi:hypothetical protein